MKAFSADELTDADRVRLATRHGDTFRGPLEMARCPHGGLIRMRWVWDVAEDVTAADAIIVAEPDCCLDDAS